MSDLFAAPLQAPNVTHLWARLLIEELVRTGVDTFFVAPGSRSTPLTVAAAQHPGARVVLHVDERGNAFAVLGWGRRTNGPAGWITTSGTAVANGQPAVVEAFVDRVPMVLLTADRPPELQDTGANQTVDQEKIFGEYVQWEANLPPPTPEIDPAYVLTTVDQAVYRACRPPEGPVHLNCAYRKPLEPVDNGATVPESVRVQGWAEAREPFTEYPRPQLHPSDPEVDALAQIIEDTREGLVVAGRLDSDTDAAAVRRLAEALGWPLVPDLTSRLRLGPDDHSARISYADLIFTSDVFREQFQPEAVLQIGGRFTSKRLRHFLRDSAPHVWAVIRPDPSRIDPDHRITHHVESSIGPFVDAFLDGLEALPGSSSWQADWKDANGRVATVVDDHTATALTEPAVAAVLTREIPSDHALVAANSMPVRDLNRHASASGAAVPVFANRGASGIDGTVATAAGGALGHDGPVTLLIGDLALWHDLNSLALLRDRPIVVVVVNNDGGGIFHFLPIREYGDVFDPYFTTPQNRDFASVAETFELAYHRPDTITAFRSAYEEATTSTGPSLIEVQTDREENRRVHEELEQAVAAVVA